MGQGTTHISKNFLNDSNSYGNNKNITWKIKQTEFSNYCCNVEGSENVFLLEFWEITFNCSWSISSRKLRTCNCFEDLISFKTEFTNVFDMRATYRSYIVPYAVAHALHDLQQCVPGQGPLDNGTCAMITNFKSWQVKREEIII